MLISNSDAYHHSDSIDCSRSVDDAYRQKLPKLLGDSYSHAAFGRGVRFRMLRPIIMVMVRMNTIAISQNVV